MEIIKMIKAENLTKKYKNEIGKYEIIFKDLNFCAKEGKFTIIQGKSGSGKTTLLNIISTIDNDYSGKLIIDKKEIHNINEHKKAKFRANNIGFIFQSYALIPEFSIIENCTIPLTMAGVSKKEAIKKAKKIIKELIRDEDENFFNKTPNELSGGQQQRIAIARALIHEPKIIIADEPTANLDEEASKEVKLWLQSLVREKGICVVVVTHEKDYLNYGDILYQFKPDETKEAKSILQGPLCLNQ
jgi:putative ABC transport system ATP-binding protein